MNKIELSQEQLDFLVSVKKSTGFVAGFGSGKTFVSALKTHLEIIKKGISKVAYYLPTYGDIRDIAFDAFPNVCDMLGYQFRLNKTDKEFTILDKNTELGTILFRNMSDPQTIVGYEVGYSLIDETDILPQEKMDLAYKKIIGRNRLVAEVNDPHLLKLYLKSHIIPDGTYWHPKLDKLCWINRIDMAGTPEGYKFFYQRFVNNYDETYDKLIKASTYSNLHNLPADYIDTMKSQYPPELFSAYVNGEFTNLTSGTVYRQYDRTLNDTDKEDDRLSELHIGIDFNVLAMSAVVTLIKNEQIFAIDEFIGLFDTPELIEAIKKKYPNRRIVCYPDASGNSRKSVNANETDIKLLRQQGFKIRVNDSNPSIMDRVNCTNASFLNTKQQRKLFINTNLCPKLTQALEQQSYDPLTQLPDKKSGHDNNGIDALGYIVSKIFPLRRNSSAHLAQQPRRLELVAELD